MKTIILAMLLALRASPVVADVIVRADPVGSSSPFTITPGYSISYSPADSINLNAVRDDSKWNASGPSFGGTGYAAISSHYTDGHAPELQLTVGNLAGGQFQISALVFTNTGLFPGQPSLGAPAYGSRLGLTANSLTTYSHASGGILLATGDNSAGPPIGQYEIRQFLLGTESSVGGTVSVFMADFVGTGTFVTGNIVGLQITPLPEPGSVILAGLGLISLVGVALRGRRAKSR